MPVTIKLTSPIFDKAKRDQAASNAISKSIKEFARYVKTEQEQSVPTGRLYRKKRGAGFRRFHRASAKGQRPAIDTGKLLNATRSKKTAKLKGEVTTIAKRKGFDYAKQLQNKMDRPIQDAPGDKRKAQDILDRNALKAMQGLR